MSYNYAGYQTALATLMATTTADTYFQTILPNCIDYAELRIYRDLDLLNTRQRDSSTQCTVGSRQVSVVSSLIVLETLAVITPAGSNPSAGTRNVLTPVTHDYIDLVYPNDGPSEYQDVPQFFAPITQTTFLVGPSPDQDYTLESFGTYRPASLSASNTSTVLTTLLPDLFLTASMIFMAGPVQKNWAGAGATSDDPGMALSYERLYQTEMQYAKSEEFRKKFESSSWSSMIPSTEANRQRG